MAFQVDYSIVVPVYNSENTLRELYDRISALMEKLNYSYSVIFVDDYSADGSWEVIQELKTKFGEKVTGIRLSRNYGQHSALICGLDFCNASFVVTIDDDLQIPPEEIETLIQKQNESQADLVYGVYRKKKHSIFRNIGSRMVESMIKNFASSQGKGSSFKLIDGQILTKIHTNTLQYVYLDEILGWYTDNVSFVEVEHHPRASGKSGYSSLKLFLFTMNILVNYTVLPLRMMTYFGIIFSLVCFTLGLYYIYDRIFNQVQLGFTSIIVAIFFGVGLILFCIGIIGEYIRRLYYSIQRKPPYSIKRIIA